MLGPALRRLTATSRWRSALSAIGAGALAFVLALGFAPRLRSGTARWLLSADGPAGAERAPVERVVDGDTLVVAGSRTVRLLGVDAPESVNPDLAGEQAFGAAASARLADLVAGREVALERDVSEADHYGRLLRHVWVGGTLVAEVLAGEGLAYAGSVPPDVRHAERLEAAEAAARRDRRGLWGAPTPTPLSVFHDGLATTVAAVGVDSEGAGVPGSASGDRAPAGPSSGDDRGSPLALRSRGAPGVRAAPSGMPLPCGARVEGAIPAESASDFVDTFQAVEFRVVRTKDTGRVTFLNSHDPYQGHFYAAVFPGDYGQFPEPPVSYFRNRCIVVQGLIERYQGAPQIVLRSPDDVRVLED